MFPDFHFGKETFGYQHSKRPTKKFEMMFFGLKNEKLCKIFLKKKIFSFFSRLFVQNTFLSTFSFYSFNQRLETFFQQQQQQQQQQSAQDDSSSSIMSGVQKGQSAAASKSANSDAVKAGAAAAADSSDGGYIENVIIIQNDPLVQEVWDAARAIRCEWQSNYKKTVSTKERTALTEVQTMRFAGDDIEVWMEIQAGKGPWADPVSNIVPIGAYETHLEKSVKRRAIDVCV